MKMFRVLLFLVSLMAAAVIVSIGATPAHFLMAGLCLFVAGNMLALPSARLCVTLTTTEILQDTLEAFRIMLPMLLGGFGTDFSNARSRKGEQIIAHINLLPSVQDYDATSGFDLNWADSDNLLEDVPVTLDQLKHVPVRVKYLTQLASRKNLYAESIKNLAYVLGKKVVDDVLSKVTATNFSYSTAIATANTTYESLEAIRSACNTQKMAPFGRFGIVSTAFAGAMGIDPRIISRDYYGQLDGAVGFRSYRNVSGFQNIWEYPDLPTTGNLTAFFGDRRALVIATRIPDVGDAQQVLNVPKIANFEVVTHAETGLSLLGITWVKPGTFDTILTMTLLYGMAGGNQGGAANAKTDRAGYWIKTA